MINDLPFAEFNQTRKKQIINEAIIINFKIKEVFMRWTYSIALKAKHCQIKTSTKTFGEL